MEGYQELLQRINSLITQTERETPDKIHQWIGQEHMGEYLKAVNLDWRLSELNVIHVAGTKGKGSTCAMVNEMLIACGYTTGLFTSPHLWDIRERIRISGKEIDVHLFRKYAERCWTGCAALKGQGIDMPRFFRFMTLVALLVFVEEPVDVVILEVGKGGRLDATNVIPKPIVCGVTSLGYDHMEDLGESLESIASHKAGIFKPGAPAFTVPQKSSAMATLEKHAKETGIKLCVAKPLDSYINWVALTESPFSASYHLENASLALVLLKQWEAHKAVVSKDSGAIERLKSLSNNEIPPACLAGLKSFNWPGRASLVQDSLALGGNLEFYLDGAHTEESMAECGKWFAKFAADPEKSRNILLFNCTGNRDAYALLRSVQHTMQVEESRIQDAVFAPLNSSKLTFISASGDDPQDLSRQHHHHGIWKQVNSNLSFPDSDGKQTSPCIAPIQPSLSTAIASFRQAAQEHPHISFRVLVTGSLFLVGDLLQLLNH